MVELNEGQSCEIVACGFSAIVKIVKFVANGIIYEFDGATHVLCSPNGKEQWHWWHNADEGFAGVNRKIESRRADGERRSEGGGRASRRSPLPCSERDHSGEGRAFARPVRSLTPFGSAEHREPEALEPAIDLLEARVG